MDAALDDKDVRHINIFEMLFIEKILIQNPNG
jgi:hypothetical protein